MIKIKRITINNFRQYRDVNLSFNDEQGLHLFIGKNGMGKSNFLNAICWCLYERQPFKFHEDDKKLLNEESAKDNKYDEVSVELEVEMEYKTFLFKRMWRETWDSSKFIVMLKTNSNWDEIDDPTLILNSFLPESISRFFLFDGEAVQNLYKGDYAKNLKDGIRRVSDVSLLDSGLEHVTKTYEEVRKRVSRDNPVTENLEEELTKLEDRKKTLESQNQSDLEMVKKLKENVIKLNEQLDKYKKYSDLQENKKHLNQEIDETAKQIKVYQEQADDVIIEYAPFWFIKEDLIETAKQINQAGLRGELPPKIKDTFINELIERHVCICGTHISNGDVAYNNLITLKEKVSPLSERTYLIEDKVSINSLIKKIDHEIPNSLKDIRSQRAQLRQKLTVLETKLKEAEEKLVNAPEAEVGNIQVTLNSNNDQIDSKNKAIGQHEFEIKQIIDQIQIILEKLERINKGKERYEMENKKASFLEEARDKIEYVRQTIIRQVRESVSANTDKYFKELIWKKEEFEKISFTEDYDVEVLKKDMQTNSLKDLSTGEMKVLSLATIKALDLLSGFADVPLFMDGPLENLDEQVQENFLELLPTFLENKQVFIFSLDKPAILEFGKKHVKESNFYRLTRVKESRSTSITKYE